MLGLAALGCGDSSVSSNATRLPVSVGSQDSIVSEDGVLALESGRLEILSMSLIGEEVNVRIIGPTSLDLAAASQEISLHSPIEEGSYAR
jgi:hypothetical protein